MNPQFDTKTLISLATFLAGAGSAVWGMVRWYGDGEKKRYAAERDFEHLRKSQEQMRQSILLLTREIDELSDDMKIHLAVFNVMLAQNGQSVSGILGYKRKNESTSDRD
ncbi:hypothetical protein C7B65_15205 [Phormidesmis priestleyi ULC007]|uniref:Uncharacterized protein n=1 Tax=Phormidesmis priestleyi ULC007 TaxID=1920490 RepID=A0A2T1DD58_9CYAN|nr:hypothetical protein [Phormidesmis priestleyi]PSB18440.1 hypothetical protein C7B65_15205 [Phormidesmis priestleyi ULC007]PZO48833.1 MAG: hypothetical protein DCF14_15985 [Phormidesmis priestleyi]